MRPLFILGCLLASALLPVSAKSPNAGADVTVIVNFKSSYSVPAIRAMEREVEQILKSSGVTVGWRSRDEAADNTFNDLVVMTFKGACVFNPMPIVYDELGPYAITRTTGGEVQPFGEVDCDHVVSSLHTAMNGEDYAKADQLLGRALGRVVAHELVHMLTKSKQHGRVGVEKAALSPRQLIADSLPLSAFDIDRLQDRHSH
jgi:hypothetical protein